jgi:hypothetical protein
MIMEPTFFARPEGPYVELVEPPRLASWDKAEHQSQVQLSRAISAAADQIAEDLVRIDGPVALRLDVGLPGLSRAALLEDHDLDNYLFPLVSHLAKATNADVGSVWATKEIGDVSRLRVSPVDPVLEPEGNVVRVLHTTASAGTVAYKQQLQAQLLSLTELDAGAVSLQLAFVVGPRRNWANLWKQTIDSMGSLLGRTSPNREWAPKDGRITELGLHRTLDPRLGDDVVVTLAASPVS